MKIRHLTPFFFCRELSYNMFSGVIPDLSKLPLLGYIRLSHNNFGCPQPYFRPSIMTPARFPNFLPGNCSADNNMMALASDGYNTVCGEDILRYMRTSVCSFTPQPWANITFSKNPEHRLNPNNGSVVLETDGSRHVFISRSNKANVDECVATFFCGFPDDY